ncbi:MAG: hypothetical protein V3T20_07595, partial [Gemmatimonadota bacterium]
NVLLDYPAKPAMLAVDLPLRMRDGRPAHLDVENQSGLLGIQHIAEELHTSARRLRVFVADSVRVTRDGVLALAERTAAELEVELGEGRALLAAG